MIGELCCLTACQSRDISSHIQSDTEWAMDCLATGHVYIARLEEFKQSLNNLAIFLFYILHNTLDPQNSKLRHTRIACSNCHRATLESD
jgi:hypothetical protein